MGLASRVSREITRQKHSGLIQVSVENGTFSAVFWEECWSIKRVGGGGLSTVDHSSRC